jgi:hypothetical protein
MFLLDADAYEEIPTRKYEEEENFARARASGLLNQKSGETSGRGKVTAPDRELLC